MAPARAIVTLLAALVAVSEAGQQEAAGRAVLNPIRKVVTLLQSMQKKVTDEGKKEKDLYDKFMCYCTTGGSDLGLSISAAETKVPAVGSSIETAQAQLVQSKADLTEAQNDRAAANEAKAAATALREKEAAAFASLKAEYDTNIAAIVKAVAALEKGIAGGFLQTGAAQVLRQLANGRADMLESDRQVLVAFLSQGSGYAPQSGEITGILKELADSMGKSLTDATNTEEAAIKTYEGLMAAKTREVDATTGTVETKTKQIGELGVAIVQMQEDLSDTEAALLEDKQFLAELDKSCASKTAEWEERSKTRADELVALADTIKVLNDDDALELFKKTLPSASASFVQFRVSATAIRARALSLVRAARHAANPQDRTGLDFLALALAGKKSSTRGAFDKVISMIDTMVGVLKTEQQNDENKKEYCSLQFDHSDDRKKAVERTLAEEENAIATTEESVATLKEEIAALEAGIQALDKSVAEATEQRKAENAEFKELLASDTASIEVLTFAKNRLNKFYNPKLYKEAAKQERTAGDRIYESVGGSLTTTAPFGIAGTGIAVLAQVSAHARRRDAPAPAPATWGSYEKKSGEGTGVIAMIDLLIKDLDKEIAEAKTEEKDAQADYEAMTADSAGKRAADSRSLTQKSSAKAELEAQLQAHQEERRAASGELMATVKYIQSLHAECDWLLQYFDVRKEARAGEVDSLVKAKAVLSGADYALLQTEARRRLRRSA